MTDASDICGCGTRAGKLLRWLGFVRLDNPTHRDEWIFTGRKGDGRITLSALHHPTRLTIAALAMRLALGRSIVRRTD